MYNLLPEEFQTYLKRDYILRVIIVAMFLLSAVAFAGMALLAPSYIVSVQNKKILEADLANAKSSNEQFSKNQTGELARVTQNKINALSSVSESKMFMPILEQIINSRPTGVSVDGITRTLAEAKTSISISGSASTRDALLQFKDGLQKTDLFESVDFPISLLAKNRDIKFTISLVMK